MDDESARTQVVEAADRLFYEHGIRAVGMAQIRDASGVSLKRLYQLFPAKDLVAAAALHQRDLAFRDALRDVRRAAADPRGADPRCLRLPARLVRGARLPGLSVRQRLRRDGGRAGLRARGRHGTEAGASRLPRRARAAKPAGRRTSAISYCCWPTARWSPPRCCTTRPPPSTPGRRPSNSSTRRPGDAPPSQGKSVTQDRPMPL